jgi:hypothetical protein
MIGILGLIWYVYKSERRMWVKISVDLAKQAIKTLSSLCEAECNAMSVSEEMKKVKAQLGAAKGTITKMKKKEGNV